MRALLQCCASSPPPTPLAVGAPDEGSPGMSLPLLFVATLCAGRRFSTLVLPGLVPGPDGSAAEPVQLQAMTTIRQCASV